MWLAWMWLTWMWRLVTRTGFRRIHDTCVDTSCSIRGVCRARGVEARFERSVTRRLGRLRRLHARVVLLVTNLFGSVIGRGAPAHLFGVSARALCLMQHLFFRASRITARVEVVLARHELGRVAVGCVLALVFGALTVPELCGERIVGAGDGWVARCAVLRAVLCTTGGDPAGEHAGCDQPAACAASEWSTYHDEFLSSVRPPCAPKNGGRVRSLFPSKSRHGTAEMKRNA
jgi:hypothetical protein